MKALVNALMRAMTGPPNRRADGRVIRERNKSRASYAATVEKVGPAFSTVKMMVTAESDPPIGGGVDFGVKYKVNGSSAGAIASVKGFV